MPDIDRTYCASSYLMYRTIINCNKSFCDKYPPRIYTTPRNRIKVQTSEDLKKALESQIESKLSNGKKLALCLSGGIDSAILAKMVPRGTVAYTFKCIVPGVEVTDESVAASKYAKECGLDHRIIKIYWEDFENLLPNILKNKGMPCHSIEVQILKAALRARDDGFDTLLFGESADCLYGGLGMLLSRDWTFGEFVERYSFLLPYKVLNNFTMDLSPFEKHEKGGFIDVHEFLGDIFYTESTNSYFDACSIADVNCFCPYANTILDAKLNLELIRSGKNKYLIREIFEKLYPNFEIPPKTPMPRPMAEWFKNWSGPTRPEFRNNCVAVLDGDQRWLVWCLEKFLNMIDD